MPRRYGNRRRYRRRSGYNRYRGRSTNQIQNRQIYKLTRRVAAINQRTKAEKIYFPFSGGTTIGTTAAVVDFTAISSTDRVGLEIYSRKLYGSLYIDNNSAALATTVRVAIVMDMQQVADTPLSFGDVFGSTSVMAQLNLTSPGRFKILWDRKISVTSQGNSRKMINLVVPIKKKIYYNGSASTDIQRHGIYMFIWSDKATNLPTYGYNIMHQYYDTS